MTAKDQGQETRQLTAMQIEANRRAEAAAAEEVPKSEVHTYPDGSQIVGVPPHPKESPIERDAAMRRAHAAAHGEASPQGMHIPPGMPTSGAPAPAPAGNTTESEFKEKVEQQLASDVASGKDPNTPNPTTSSDKPGLANIVTADQLETSQVLSDNPTPAEIAAIAADIKPTGELVKDATDEQKEAAALQVARETKGPVVADPKDTSSKAKK